jgi:two-component system, OmpR family, response regulator
MPPRPPSDDDVFALTSTGQAELRASGTGLSSGELHILVLMDGAATLVQVVTSAKLARNEVVETLQKLVQKKLIAKADEPAALETGFFAIPPSIELLRSGKNVEPEAEQGVASLTRKGYFVRIARRAPQKRDVAKGWQPTVLVIDDDPDLQKLIQMYLGLDGFNMRQATKRDEIMAAFRQQPMPDVVLLDVNMPDANGFHVLARMREHAILKAIPVILITAEATREAVLKGLNAGADGYITKPFEPDWIVTAVKEVLGLPLTPYRPL